MDFGSIQTVAVMPFINLTRRTWPAKGSGCLHDDAPGDGGVYVIPPVRWGGGSPADPRTPGFAISGEVVKFAKNVNADAVFTGTLSEYGEVRSGTSTQMSFP